MARIILTEDDPEQRNLYHEILEEAGYEVMDAWNATEALELFQRYKPDLVILDIQMPGMDGVEALGRIVTRDKQIPVILYTAFPAQKANFLTWAADAFVVKTGDTKELLNAVERILKERGVQIPAAAQNQEATVAELKGETS